MKFLGTLRVDFLPFLEQLALIVSIYPEGSKVFLGDTLRIVSAWLRNASRSPQNRVLPNGLDLPCLGLVVSVQLHLEGRLLPDGEPSLCELMSVNEDVSPKALAVSAQSMKPKPRCPLNDRSVPRYFGRQTEDGRPLSSS